jgi:hypothetical protein
VRARSIVSAPARLFHLPARKEPSPETVEQVSTYLRRNDLTDVRIFVNSYEPREQWRLLRENKSIGAGWRYTAGTIGVVTYTLFPGPVFRHDSYNPYTNSLNLNFDASAVALCEAASAKDVHEQKLPGTYLVLNSLPGIGMWRQCRIASDLTSYAQEQKDWKLERDTYRHVYPHLGSQSVAVAAPLVATTWWMGPAFNLAGAGAGFVTGRTVEVIRHWQSYRTPARPDVEPDAAPIGPEVDGQIQLTGAVERLPATGEIELR